MKWQAGGVETVGGMRTSHEIDNKVFKQTVDLNQPGVDQMLQDYIGTTLGQDVLSALQTIWLKEVKGTELGTALSSNGLKAAPAYSFTTSMNAPIGVGTEANKFQVASSK